MQLQLPLGYVASMVHNMLPLLGCNQFVYRVDSQK